MAIGREAGLGAVDACAGACVGAGPNKSTSGSGCGVGCGVGRFLLAGLIYA